jgi:hypothetical protein
MLSSTVTENEHDADCRPLSTATQLTVVVEDPRKEEPDAGVHVLLLIPELSVALKEKVTVAFVLPASGPVDTSAGQETTGGIVSTMLMLNEQDVDKLKLLVAVHVTVLLPRLNSDPLAGVQDDETEAPAGSETVGAKATRAEAELFAVCTSWLPGHMMFGGEFWLTAMENTHEDCRLALSKATQENDVVPMGIWVCGAGRHVTFLIPEPSVGVGSV